MLNMTRSGNCIPTMTEMEINSVRQLEKYTLQAPQTDIATHHVLHAGMYARTIKIPAGVILTGALIKIATLLIVSGDCIVYMGDKSQELHGYHTLAASGNRKQAFIAKTDTYLTMVFATDAEKVDQAEERFTDEFSLLSSRRDDAVNHIVVTGE